MRPPVPLDPAAAAAAAAAAALQYAPPAGSFTVGTLQPPPFLGAGPLPLQQRPLGMQPQSPLEATAAALALPAGALPPQHHPGLMPHPAAHHHPAGLAAAAATPAALLALQAGMLQQPLAGLPPAVAAPPLAVPGPYGAMPPGFLR